MMYTNTQFIHSVHSYIHTYIHTYIQCNQSINESSSYLLSARFLRWLSRGDYEVIVITRLLRHFYNALLSFSGFGWMHFRSGERGGGGSHCLLLLLASLRGSLRPTTPQSAVEMTADRWNGLFLPVFVSPLFTTK